MTLLLVFIAGIASFLYWLLLKKYGSLWGVLDDFKTDVLDEQSVSIVIPFRNEELFLGSLLCSLVGLEKERLEVEVILVDDHSTDDSLAVIDGYRDTLNIKVLSLNKSYGKKEALKLGWDAAASEIIIQTDADCIVTEEWLETMVAPFKDEKIMMVSGPVKYFKAKNFFARIVEYDFLGLIAIGASHIAWKLPMICNGANMAYRKKVIKDIELLDHKASGDDVFLMQSVYEKDVNSIVFVKHKSAIVETVGPAGFKEFWNQRLRWASKNGDYSIRRNTLLLVGLWVYNLLILGVFLSFTGVGVLVGFYLLVMKILAETTFYSKFMPFFEKKNWWKALLLGQPFHVLYMSLLPPLSQVLKYTWKERKLK